MRNKVSRYIKKYWLLLLVVGLLTLLILIPFIINVLFKYDSGIWYLQAEWRAEDALSFYGTLLAASIGIAGVFFSIQYAQKNYRQDEKNRVKPYLALTYLRERSQFTLGNLVSLMGYSSKDDEEICEDQPDKKDIFYRLDHIAIILSAKGIEYNTDITDAQKDLIQNGGVTLDDGKIKKRKFISMPFIIENVGNGAALNCRIAFYEENDTPRGININTVKCGDAFYCHIFSDDVDNFLNKQYILKFSYLDILGTEYTQLYDINFTIDAATKLVKQSILLSGEQKEESIWNI